MQGLTERVTLSCGKITGGNDCERVESELGAVDGVRDVESDASGHTVTVTYDPTIVNLNVLQERLGSIGYKVDSSQ